METKYPDQMIHQLCPDYFIPSGNLIIKDKDKQSVLHNWIQNEIEPYLKEDTQSFYLSGKVNKDEKLQICSDPLNILSYDCLDAINLWVLEK